MKQVRVVTFSTLIVLLCSVLNQAQQSEAAAAKSAAGEDVRPAVSGTGAVNYIPLWLTTTKLGKSQMYQSATGEIGVGTTSPGAALDVNGAINAATGFNLGGSPFAFQSNGNVAVGGGALSSDTTGYSNVAVGADALYSNSTSSGNTAVGDDALTGNTGNENTAVGFAALSYINAGTLNSALGYYAGIPVSTNLTNSTAIGAYAQATTSNSMVLGAVNGVNACVPANNCAGVSVGIGTTAPVATLDVVDNGSGGNTISATTSNDSESAIFASNTATSGSADGGFFNTYSPSGSAVVGVNYGSGGQAAYFQGSVSIVGHLSKSSGSFKIDHPLDPANKYLYHSFVESPDMKNIYDGVATLDAQGSVWILMPDYFEALNQEFRYQLTSIGRPQPGIYIAQEISGNRFRISGGKPGGKVSWQVTGIRHDAYADAHRIKVEEEKPPQEQGRYLHPELFGAPPEQAIGYRMPPARTPADGAREAAENAAPRAEIEATSKR
jgi:hypothetical protein